MERVRQSISMTLCSLFAVAMVAPVLGQGTAKGKGEVDQSGKFTPSPPVAKPGEKRLTPAEAREALQKSLKVEPMGGDKFRIGDVVLDKKARTVTFPVKVNMVEGVVEYVLVTEQGKAHEAIFTTTVRPVDVHLACVLMGMKELPGREWPKRYDKIETKNALKVEVTWPTNGPPKRISLAQCVRLASMQTGQPGKKTLAEGKWLYSGSHFQGGTFASQSEGSLIAVIGDYAALINGLREHHGDDMMHHANKDILPSKGRTVKLVLTLPKNG